MAASGEREALRDDLTRFCLLLLLGGALIAALTIIWLTVDGRRVERKDLRDHNRHPVRLESERLTHDIKQASFEAATAYAQFVADLEQRGVSISWESHGVAWPPPESRHRAWNGGGVMMADRRYRRSSQDSSSRLTGQVGRDRVWPWAER